MKKIEAVIRPERLEAVLVELKKMKYPGITITEVKGHGKQKGAKHMWRGAEYIEEFIQKVKVEIVVLDEDLPSVARAIIKSARVGNVGDGKIFISDIDDAIRIRTGESGFNAI